MKYRVKQSTLKDYLEFKASDQELFPTDAPRGASYYDLEPENGEPKVVKFEHVENAIKMYINKQITFDVFAEWIDSIIALDLFTFNDDDDESLDRVAGLVYSIDDLKDNVSEIDLDKLQETLNKYKC